VIGVIDPAAAFMHARRSAYDSLHRYFSIWTGRVTQPDRLERALADLGANAAVMPRDERLWYHCGHLLLRLGRAAEASAHLWRALELFSCQGGIRAGTLYDLACASAILGQEHQCREYLQKSGAIRQLEVAWLAKDPDLETVRKATWFQELLSSKPEM
jgi:hypothetical protein